MVEVAAVEYFLWRHWTAEHMQRATSEPRRESYDYNEWREKQKEALVQVQWTGEADRGAMDSGCLGVAVPKRGGCCAAGGGVSRRAYHASIRALRDWRRYPVIVQNAGQVNIAADGGQQVNVQAERKRKKTPKGTMAARKLKP